MSNILPTIMLILAANYALAMNKARPRYTFELLNYSAHKSDIIEHKYCAFHDTSYPNGYCVSLFREFPEHQKSHRQYIADQELLDSQKKSLTLRDKIIILDSKYRTRNNFYDMQDKHIEQEKNKLK